MSYWDHRKPTRRARAVAIADIARESSAILDEGGLRALTVRAVAGRLNVAPASLYSRIEAVDDLFDLALDDTLGRDPDLTDAMSDATIHALMMTYFRHLRRHRWACQVIAMRAPRGPNYLRLSERMIVLLRSLNVPDALGTAYALSNFVIGSAATAEMASDERTSTIDPAVAPEYAELHERHSVSPDEIVDAGLTALLPG